MSIESRFNDKWEPVTETGCWLWTGALSTQGYARINYKGKNTFAHRLSWEIHNGPIPVTDSYHGICVLHKCDTPVCVNPKHLFLGSHRINMEDMKDKGRSRGASGSENGNSSLTEEQVVLIRADTRRANKIAIDYGVTGVTIGDVKSFKTWKHVGGSN